MLQKIPLLDAGVIRALIVALVGLIGIICSFFGVDEAIFSDDRVSRLADAFATLLTLGGVVWAMISRSVQPTPPLTDTAMAKTQELISDGKLKTTTGDSTRSAQGGFARAAMIGVMLALGSIVGTGAALSGCVNTRAALKAADSPSDFALVFLEGYDAALKTANALKDSGALTGSDLLRVREAELKAWPLVQKIDPLRSAYERTQSAADAQALQLAIDEAIREAADFVRIVRELRGKQP